MPYSAWVEQRRNLHPNPEGVNGAGWAAQTDFAQSVGPDGILYTATSANQVARQVGGSATGTANLAPLSAGTTYYGSVVVVTQVTRNLRASINVRNSSGSEITNLHGEWVTVQAGVPTSLYVSGEAPTGATWGGVRIWRNSDVAITVGEVIAINRQTIATTSGPGFSGSTPYSNVAPVLLRNRWEGNPNSSQSIQETRTYTAPTGGITPEPTRSVQDVLYGDRITSYRWEVLRHESDGTDSVVGTLDGVSDATLRQSLYAAVKGSGTMEIIDLDTPQAGMLSVAGLTLETVRFRPVQQIDGLPDNPLGSFLVSTAKEKWAKTGRVWALSLLDRTTVPQQDAFEESYAVAAGANILAQVKSVLASCNEFITVDTGANLLTASNMVWEAGTSKLTIINDLLDAAGYGALTIDGNGNFLATPRVLPADRPLTYDVLGLPRELADGQKSIYTPDWDRERDSFDVPNKVIAIEGATGTDTAAIVGTWTNEDPKSPYSYQSRGRWIPYVLDNVDVADGTAAQKLAALRARARATLVQMSAVQAEVKLEHVPLPLRVGDVLRFAHSKAGINSRHMVTAWSLEANSLGLMKTTIQEVISL